MIDLILSAKMMASSCWIHFQAFDLKEDEHAMSEVQCVTCGQSGESITDQLFMGKLETEIKSKVCKPCWKKWESMRVMVINEYQVNLGDESGRELVKNQMKAFLKIGAQADTSKLDQNYRPQP